MFLYIFTMCIFICWKHVLYMSYTNFRTFFLNLVVFTHGSKLLVAVSGSHGLRRGAEGPRHRHGGRLLRADGLPGALGQQRPAVRGPLGRLMGDGRPLRGQKMRKNVVNMWNDHVAVMNFGCCQFCWFVYLFWCEIEVLEFLMLKQVYASISTSIYFQWNGKQGQICDVWPKSQWLESKLSLAIRL